MDHRDPVASSARDDKSILVVGLTCIDIVCISDGYPLEDSDKRCLDYYWQRGGNASNNCTVLAELGARVECFSTLANSREFKFIEDDFRARSIGWTRCPIVDGGQCPVSVCIINGRNGSRTILHTDAKLREVTTEDFSSIHIADHSWIHFEGRYDVAQIEAMLAAIDEYNSRATTGAKVMTSVELEKPNRQLDVLLNKADFVFVGKSYALHCGYRSMHETVGGLHPKCRQGATVICTWGDCGAAAMTRDGAVHQVPCHSPDVVRDTLGAGDTFLAATVLSLNDGCSVGEAIRWGCTVAGEKCGIKGFTGLKHLVSDYKSSDK